jgi:hypothetical protein
MGGQVMANKKAEAKATGRRRGERTSGTGDEGRIKDIGTASSRIVTQAAALLDEEIAAGIVAAKQVQQRFQKERRIDPRDFRDALQRFQRDGHEVVDLIDQQLGELRSKENAELTTRLLRNVHDLLDLATGLVNMGAEIAGQLALANLPKPDGGSTERRNR